MFLPIEMILKRTFGLFVLFITPFVLAYDDFANFLPQMNNLRRKFARNHDIANMNELIWDKKLVENANQRKDTDATTVRINSNDIFEEAVLSLTKYYAGLVPNITLNSENKETLTSGSAAFLYPLFKYIGCANSDGMAVCYLTPKPFEASGYDITGEPGSKCPDGYENNAGLCSIIPPTTYIPTTNAPTTEALKPEPTQCPCPVPAKQTSDEQQKDSGGSDDVIVFDEEISTSYHLASVASVTLFLTILLSFVF